MGIRKTIVAWSVVALLGASQIGCRACGSGGYDYTGPVEAEACEECSPCGGGTAQQHSTVRRASRLAGAAPCDGGCAPTAVY